MYLPILMFVLMICICSSFNITVHANNNDWNVKNRPGVNIRTTINIETNVNISNSVSASMNIGTNFSITTNIRVNVINMCTNVNANIHVSIE